jgi:putative ABC transport system permease protein
MLISVRERTVEFGVRKAIGATPGSIIAMVMAEALLLTLVSGYLGLVAAVGLLEAGSALLPPENDILRNPTINLNVAMLAVLVLSVAGTLAGYFPAHKAARIRPVQALRNE